MNLDRRQFLAGILGTATGRLPIGNLPQKVFEVMNQGGFPVDFSGVSDDFFRKQMAKVSGIDSDTIEKFLREREGLAQRCAQTGQSILSELGITEKSGKRILVTKRTPVRNHEMPEFIDEKNGFAEMSWKDFFQWEGRHTIEGKFQLESGVSFPCSDEGHRATGNIYVHFDAQKISKLVLHITTENLRTSFGNSLGIEIPVENIGEIQKQIFDWKSRDWSQEILKKEEYMRQQVQEATKRLNQEEYEKRQKQKVRNMKLLHSTTSLTSPEQTLALHKNTKTLIDDARMSVAKSLDSHREMYEGISLWRIPEVEERDDLFFNSSV